MTKAQIISKNDDTIVIEIEDGYSAVLLELPDGFTPESFFKSTETVEISKPYPNEHSCPHAEAGKFETMRSGSRTSDGKSYRVLYGRVKGGSRWEVASFRYPKATWTPEEARKHCKAHQGLAFEPAISKTDTDGCGCGEVDTKSKEKTLLEIDVDGVKKSVELEHVMKKDDSKHLVFGVCLEPGVVDSQNDFETPETIQLAIHKFMYKMWQAPERAMVGSEHRNPIHGAVPVQCYQAPVDFWFPGTPETEEYMVKKDSWVLVTHVKSDIEFAKVVSGEYSGYSIQGSGTRKRLP